MRAVGEIATPRRSGDPLQQLIAASSPMREVFELIRRVAPTDAAVFLSGESGTGKELVARSVHLMGARRRRAFVAVNCGAIAAGLIESELFGHERGSFTGAERCHRGFFEQACGGTLFLDEITETPAALQVKLLRVLETGTVIRVGGSESIEVDVRIVAATNRDPYEAVREGRLREDLLYRLRVFPIDLPPLRARPGDVALLASHFLALLNETQGCEKRLAAAAIDALQRRRWPGNVRELRNVLERAFILADDEIGPELLAEEPEEIDGGACEDVLEFPVGTSLAELERRAILATLARFGGDKARTASVLGCSLRTIYNRLKQYGAPIPVLADPALE